MSDSQPTVSIHNTANTEDHDRLIRIDEKLDRAISDIKELKDNVASRVTDLENEKVSKEEFLDYKDQIDKEIDELKAQIDPLRRLVYIGLGIMLALDFLILALIQFYKP